MRKRSLEHDLNEARPIVKWAGGKAELVSALLPEVPAAVRTYVEPFAGGAALFFALASAATPRFRKARLNDRNAELVACYRAVRDHLPALVARLSEYRYDKELYYQVRELDPRALGDVERGARLLFLNRTCFNGLWRENSKGKFNVPFGTYKNPRILDPLLLGRASSALAGVRLSSEDFEGACQRLGPGDFVYFDPPYVPVTRTASFTAYSATGFTMVDQQRLVALMADLQRRGVQAMLSNADTPETRALYAQFRLRSVSARRSINSDPSKRGAASELIVTNFEPPSAGHERGPRRVSEAEAPPPPARAAGKKLAGPRRSVKKAPAVTKAASAKTTRSPGRVKP